ncbi:MAG TPA: TIGR00730 family Rossman fold protein [Dehalococcoidia bacterium]|nr:TIGR00730 family Rossman fold protein [Dehalococcoidia bacterium]
MTNNRREIPQGLTGVDPLEPLSRRTTPARQRMRRRAGSGDRALDEQIRALVASAQPGDADLLEDTIATAFRMARTANRGEMKLVSRSLRELGRAFRIFAPYRGIRKVSIFGSARTTTDHAEYAAARDFSRGIAQRGWMVITGAGPGIMAAGHEGAGAEKSFGVGIKLPIEQGANSFIAGDPKLIDFKYFFTRKIMFMKESDAFVLLPGGFGTLDEAFELLTLMQTGKTALRPVVLFQPPGSFYWSEWLAFVRAHLVDKGFASPEDLALFEVAASADDAIRIIERFYVAYHSARYVGERLVLRLQRAPSPARLAALNDAFRDIVVRGRIEPIAVTAEEARDGDCVDLPRIAMYPGHNFGRIRQLIDALNAAE